jgi:hypothetical protein
MCTSPYQGLFSGTKGKEGVPQLGGLWGVVTSKQIQQINKQTPLLQGFKKYLFFLRTPT